MSPLPAPSLYISRCPFCSHPLGSDADRHVLACSLVEIMGRGPRVELAAKCERAARR